MPEKVGLETAISAVKLVLENLWTLGLLFATFAGVCLLASRHGMAMSPDILKYCPVAFVFGISCIIVSAIVWLGELIQSNIAKFLAWREKKIESDGFAEEATKNLDTLSDGEIVALVAILSASDKLRWEIRYGTEASGLITKRILVHKDDVGSGVLCELEPGIAKDRDYFLKKFGGIIAKGNRRFDRLKPFERQQIY